MEKRLCAYNLSEAICGLELELSLQPCQRSADVFTFDSFKMTGYAPHPLIKAPITV